ncbi:PIG-L deacetylase family protein [Streptomyces sp. SP18CS02]|uniref:PIG-L deacetylase family protein n=1 Tax=Streptomyces sp. SP18CS02 TaxID=3002531 RepID=UPI002E76397D|nr:PIG-L family deacetylase [Streptomyces sp. SP18CS02]MEE1752020.1 PIG-L family deacetylase [Streptomyces sp. SP18CS02]
MDSPAPSRTVVISPHFDDAALSLAGLLPGLPGPVDVVTVHGGAPAPGSPVSWWDTQCGFSSAAEAHRARRAEDAAACALLGAAQIVLDHPDGPYRPEGATLDGLEAFLRDLPPDTRVLVPLGSNQPDHEAVRRLAVRVLADRGAPLPWVYADLPYTGHLPEWGRPGASDALALSRMCGLAYQDLLTTHRTHVRYALTLDDAQWAVKRAAVLCHGSQLAPLAADHGGFLARTGPLSAELVWSLEPRDAVSASSVPLESASC